MSTAIAQPVPVRAPDGLVSIPAAALMPGDLYLVEQHVVRGIATGPREVAAIVLRSHLTLDGLVVIEWAGAVPGEHISTGTSVYETCSPVLALLRNGMGS